MNVREALQEAMDIWDPELSLDQYLDDCAANAANLLDLARLPLLALTRMQNNPNIQRLYQEVTNAADAANLAPNPWVNEIGGELKETL